MAHIPIEVQGGPVIPATCGRSYLDKGLMYTQYVHMCTNIVHVIQIWVHGVAAMLISIIFSITSLYDKLDACMYLLNHWIIPKSLSTFFHFMTLGVWPGRFTND